MAWVTYNTMKHIRENYEELTNELINGAIELETQYHTIQIVEDNAFRLVESLVDLKAEYDNLDREVSANEEDYNDDEYIDVPKQLSDVARHVASNINDNLKGLLHQDVFEYSSIASHISELRSGQTDLETLKNSRTQNIIATIDDILSDVEVADNNLSNSVHYMEDGDVNDIITRVIEALETFNDGVVISSESYTASDDDKLGGVEKTINSTIDILEGATNIEIADIITNCAISISNACESAIEWQEGWSKNNA